jgi:hypothetical protein
MHTPPVLAPALSLWQDLDAGKLFTSIAEAACGQAVRVEVETVNPPYLWADEARQLDMARHESWAALRRVGEAVQADGRPVARITSVVAVGRLDHASVLRLTTTGTPLGRVLEEKAERDGTKLRRELTDCVLSLDEHVVHCRAVLSLDDMPVAMASEQPYWAWLNAVSGPAVPAR